MQIPFDHIGLFERLKEDDEGAFDQIYNLYSRKILNFAYSFSICIEDAEEIVHDTFIRLWTIRRDLDLNKPVDSLMFVIAKNLTLNKVKQYGTARENLKKYFREKEDVFYQLEDAINFHESKALLDKIIGNLPEKRRQIFMLNRYDGLTYREIAAKLGISLGTVEKQMKKALDTISEDFSALSNLILYFAMWWLIL